MRARHLPRLLRNPRWQSPCSSCWCERRAACGAHGTGGAGAEARGRRVCRRWAFSDSRSRFEVHGLVPLAARGPWHREHTTTVQVTESEFVCRTLGAFDKKPTSRSVDSLWREIASICSARVSASLPRGKKPPGTRQPAHRPAERRSTTERWHQLPRATRWPAGVLSSPSGLNDRLVSRRLSGAFRVGPSGIITQERRHAMRTPNCLPARISNWTTARRRRPSSCTGRGAARRD